MRKLLPGALALSLLCLPASWAYGQVSLGPQVTAADEVDLGVGVVVEAPLTSFHEALEFGGAFTFYFPDNGDHSELEGTVRYLFHLPDSDLVPFALGGLGIGFASHEHNGHQNDETQVDLRFGGGIKAHMEDFTPFAELALGVGDGPDFAFRAGLAFELGSGGNHH